MTIQEALLTGNKIRHREWHPENYYLVYEGNTFFKLSRADLLSHDWESSVVELPPLERWCPIREAVVTDDPEGKVWNSRRGVWVESTLKCPLHDKKGCACG